MPKRKEPATYTILDRPAECPVCGHDRFWHRMTLLNTAGASFLNFDWANREAVNLVCDRCSHMQWFHDGFVLKREGESLFA